MSYAHHAWSAASPINAGTLGSAPAVAVRADGARDVFWEGTDGHLWNVTSPAPGSAPYPPGFPGAAPWSRPAELSAGTLGSAPAVCVDAAGNEYVFWKGTDGRLWEAVNAGGWTVGRLVGGRIASPPAAGVDAAGKLAFGS